MTLKPSGNLQGLTMKHLYWLWGQHCHAWQSTSQTVPWVQHAIWMAMRWSSIIGCVFFPLLYKGKGSSVPFANSWQFFRRNFQIMVPRQRRHRDRITVHVTAAIGWMFLVAMINASGSSVGVAGALWQLQFPLPWLRCLIPNDRSMEGSSIPIRGLFKDYCTPWTIHLTFSEPHPSPIQARKQPPENWLHHLLSFWLEISWWIWVPKLSGSISKAAWSEAFVMPIRCDGTAYVMHVRRQR